MSAVDNSEIEFQSNKEIKKCCKCECACNSKKEIKDYVKRAKRNYRIRRLENDPEYAEQLRQKHKEYREKHKEKYNESRRNYLREYRAKKKAEKQKDKHAESTSIQIGLENLTIKDETLEPSLVHPTAST